MDGIGLWREGKRREGEGGSRSQIRNKRERLKKRDVEWRNIERWNE